MSVSIAWGVLEGAHQQFAETLRSEQSLEESEGVCQAKEGSTDTQSKGSYTCYGIHYFLGCAFPSTERHLLRQIIPGGTSLNISCVCFYQIISSSSLIFLLPFLMLASTLYKSSLKCFVPCISWMGMWGTMGIFSFKNWEISMLIEILLLSLFSP